MKQMSRSDEENEEAMRMCKKDKREQANERVLAKKTLERAKTLLMEWGAKGSRINQKSHSIYPISWVKSEFGSH